MPTVLVFMILSTMSMVRETTDWWLIRIRWLVSRVGIAVCDGDAPRRKAASCHNPREPTYHWDTHNLQRASVRCAPHWTPTIVTNDLSGLHLTSAGNVLDL